MSGLTLDLRATAVALREAAAVERSEGVSAILNSLESAVREIAGSWSGSNMGYHAHVYYEDFKDPPPGAHFSSEWGLMGFFNGSTGEWREYADKDVLGVIEGASGVSEDGVAPLLAAADNALESWREGRSQIGSVFATFLADSEEPFVSKLASDLDAMEAVTLAEVRRGMVSLGSRMTRDTTAYSQGFRLAPHQQAIAPAVYARSVFRACRDLATFAERAATHVERVEGARTSRGQGSAITGDRVFIGHGQAPAWRDLKDFVRDRLELPWDEFNRVPVAGVTNIARLAEMLDNAAVAFVVLTAEDETSDGQERARQNVVHEAGLFQGRLGFTRAIIMLEDGCEEFSNIEGLGQIRFPAGNISAKFDEVRQVLEREGILPAAR